MTDIVTINAVLTSLKTAMDIAKAIRSADASLEKAETKLKMAGLIDALAEAKMQIVEVQDVIAEKDNRIADLEAAFEFKGKLVRYLDAYYESDPAGKAVGSPYCTRCWEVDYESQASQTSNPGSGSQQHCIVMQPVSFSTGRALPTNPREQ